MKIENRIKKNQQLGIRELGDFCAQYGYERITPPSTTKRKSIKKNKIIPRSSPKTQTRKGTTPENPMTSNNTQIDKSKIVCYKCGRLRHYKKDCRTKEKNK